MNKILLLPVILAAPLLAQAQDLYEVCSHLIVNGEVLEKQLFTTPPHEMQVRFYEDKNGKPYKVLYQVIPGEQAGTVEVFTRVSTPVMIANFLLPDNEQASMIIKHESPEYEMVVKAHKLTDKAGAKEK